MANGQVREYIGARYVPIFADPVQWDNEREYEPLTMVQKSGETYMSKQYVPIGVDLPDVAGGDEDNDYWVHMSNWNAQVEGYREEVLRYAEEVLTFDGRIDTLEDDLPTSSFDSTNTVKKAIDDAVALLPGTSFDTTNTVSKAISDMGDLLPASAFDSINTVDARFDVIEANDWVGTQRIDDLAVTTAKLANSSVTEEKLSSSIPISTFSGRLFKSIEEYGCDATLDDNSTYLQNALNDAAGKYILYSPAKTFKFESPVVVPWNTYLLGLNRHSSCLKFYGCNGLVCDNDVKGYLSCINVVLDNFTLSGNYPYVYSDMPSEPAFTGISGWFSNCDIRNINIDHFYTGMNLLAPDWISNDYNLYNNEYGDQRIFRNICVMWGMYGIECNEWDTFWENISIAHIGKETGRWISSEIVNLHAWDCPYVYFRDGTRGNNIEIESVFPEWQAQYGHNGTFSSPIETDPLNNNVILNNVLIWNIDTTETMEAGYNHPYIRMQNGSTGNLCVTNLNIGRQANGSTTTAPKRLYEQHGSGYAYIQGCVSPTLTTCSAGDFIMSNQNKGVFNILCNPSLSGSNVGSTSYNVKMSTTNIT